VAKKDTNSAPVFAAIDLGSNSFHMIVARLVDGQLQVLDRLREMVRMAAGLDEDNRLSEDAQQRGLECLARFGERLNSLHPSRIRVVGTNTLRKAKRGADFLRAGKKALGYPIEVVSGAEEARLIYLGVAHTTSLTGRQLVVDIGGGSTELIIGTEFEPHALESVFVGCVSMTQRFFADGRITKGAMRRAEMAARLELQPVFWEFHRQRWDGAIGASGSVKAIRSAVLDRGWSLQGISYDALAKLRQAVVEVGHADRLPDHFDVSSERAPVFAGAVAILSGVFESLGIDTMAVSAGALREGLIFDLIGRSRNEDVRGRTVENLVRRYTIDVEHAGRVAKTALGLYSQVSTDWGLDAEDLPWFLEWSAMLHEIGLSIAHTQYHKHGGYIIEYADLAGFSLGEQRILAILVRGHRRKFPTQIFEDLPTTDGQPVLRLCVLLRLAVLLHRGRSEGPPPETRLTVSRQGVTLEFPEGWLDERPMTLADFEQERSYLKAAEVKLRFGPIADPAPEVP